MRFGSLQDCKNRRYCTMCNVDEWPAFFLNFFFMAGECWFFCQAMDLYFSLKNPFYSFKGRIVTYHAFVWIFALLDSLVPWLLDLTNKDKHWFDIYGFSEGQGAQVGAVPPHHALLPTLLTYDIATTPAAKPHRRAIIIPQYNPNHPHRLHAA